MYSTHEVLHPHEHGTLTVQIDKHASERVHINIVDIELPWWFFYIHYLVERANISTHLIMCTCHNTQNCRRVYSKSDVIVPFLISQSLPIFVISVVRVISRAG